MYFTYNAHDYKLALKGIQPHDPCWTGPVLSTMPVTFFSIAVTLNLNNWMFYYFKIGEMASHIDERAKDHANLSNLKQYSKILNWITGITIVMVSVPLTVIIILDSMGKVDDEFMFNVVELASGTLCIILGLAFAVSGFMNNRRLKKYFPDFFEEHKLMLITASIGLSMPVLLRGILNLARLNDDFDNFIQEKEAMYDSMFFILTEMIPLSFQLSSLIFGYIRGKKDKKYQLEIQEDFLETNGRDQNNMSKSSKISNSSLTVSNFD